MTKNQIFWAVVTVVSTIASFPKQSLIVIGVIAAAGLGFWLANRK